MDKRTIVYCMIIGYWILEKIKQMFWGCQYLQWKPYPKSDPETMLVVQALSVLKAKSGKVEKMRTAGGMRQNLQQETYYPLGRLPLSTSAMFLQPMPINSVQGPQSMRPTRFSTAT